MAQISRNPLKRDVEEQMFAVFLKTVASLRNEKEIDDLFNDLLSPIEKMMLAKRLTIALLLSKGYTYPMIENILKVTPTTIAAVSMQLRYVGKGYKYLVEQIVKDPHNQIFWQKIEDAAGEVMFGKKSKQFSKKNRRSIF